MVVEPTGAITDEDLRDLVVRDASKGWEVLWSVYGSRIRARVYSFQGLRDHYADLQQEVSLKILRDGCSTLRKWDPTKGSLAAFLSCVTRSVCLDYIKSSFYQYSRRKQETPESEQEEHNLFEVFPSEESSPIQTLEKRELSTLFHRAIHELAETDHLKPDDLSLIYLRAKGAEYDEVARITGKSKESLMMRFSRIRPLLRSKMESLGITLEILQE